MAQKWLITVYKRLIRAAAAGDQGGKAVHLFHRRGWIKEIECKPIFAGVQPGLDRDVAIGYLVG